MAAQFNPYRKLAAQARALLRTEADMPPEHRAHLSWLIRAEFAGTSVVVGKGGFNTMFAQYGAGSRVVNFPNKIISTLDKLARQEFAFYQVSSSTLRRVRWTAADALKEAPKTPGEIVGVRADGSHVKTHEARKNVRGKLAWVRVAP